MSNKADKTSVLLLLLGVAAASQAADVDMCCPFESDIAAVSDILADLLTAVVVFFPFNMPVSI